MSAVFKSLALSLIAFVSTSWLLMKGVAVYKQIMDLKALQAEQRWPLHQCRTAHEFAARHIDCDKVLRIANTSAWDVVKNIDHVQAFFMFPALLCSILWATAVLKLLYK